MTNEKASRVKSYIISIAIALAVGLFSALLTRDSMDIYSQLITPPLAPPGWLFPVVWTVLYVLMGVGAAIIWEQQEEDPAAASNGISVYALSLGFNFLWRAFPCTPSVQGLRPWKSHVLPALCAGSTRVKGEALVRRLRRAPRAR